MTARRLFIFMIFPVILLMLWSLPVSAEDPVAVVTPESGECKIDDNYKKLLAQQAYTALYNARNAYMQYVKILKNDYEAEGGVCHNLYSSWQHNGLNSFFSGGLEGANQLSWTDADRKGAEVVDSGQYKAKMSPSCTQMMEEIDKNDGYTDWNIHKMVDMAVSADASVQKVFSWAQTAPDGASIDISDEASKSICSAIGGGKTNGCSSTTFSHNDCNKIVKKGSSLVCVDTGSGSSSGYRLTHQVGTTTICTHGANNKCYVGSIQREDREISCSECVMNVNDSDIAYVFPSLDSFKNTMKNGNSDPNTAACLKKLEEAEQLRGRKGSGSGFIGYRSQAENALSILGGAPTECTCEKDEEGKPTDKIAPINEETGEGGCKSMQKTTEDNLEETCPTIGEYQAELGNICITCGLMANILGAAQIISEKAFTVISGDLIRLLEIAFLIFIAYTVLLAVASPEAVKPSKILTDILMQGARVAIAILILTYPEVLYEKALNPILDGAIDFGLSFANVKHDGNGDMKYDESFAAQIQTAGADYFSGAKAKYKSAGDERFLSTATLEKMVGANKNFSKEAAFMPALGSCLICNATHNIPSGEPRYGVIPRMKMLTTGLILLIFGVMIWLAVGFYILDCCLQLCLVVAMMSFFVACWAFKLTSGYVKVGWNMFLNTFFNFVMMSVVVVTIALLTSQAVKQIGMPERINNNELEAIENNLEIIGLGIIVVVVVCLICLKLSNESGRLANKFAGGAQIKMGGDLGGMAAGAVTQGFKSSLKATGKAVGTLGKVGGSIAESSGLKGAAVAGKQAVKGALGGKTKSKGASFKQNDAQGKGDKGSEDKGSEDKGDGGNG